MRFATILSMLVVLSGGCASSPRMTLDQAVADFNAQRYAQAHEKAKSLSDRPSAPNRHDAAYIAGMSAFQLGMIEEADRQLQIAINSSNAHTSAQAKAVLGQIRLDQRRSRDAAELLCDASNSLDGEDKLKAAANASLAYQQMGDVDSARAWRMKAQGQTPQPIHASSSSSTLPTVESAPGSQGFTLQVGAFQEKKRAENAAKEALKLAQREGWGQVRIVPRRDSRGKATYLVQFGTFATRESAAAARARIGRLDYIVAVAGKTS